MKIHGFGLLEVSKPEDAKWFLNMYEQTHWENIVKNETFRVRHLNQFEYKYVAFIQAGGGIDRIVELSEKDFIKFYSQQGLEGFSNTSGMGFVRCFEHDGKYDFKEMAMFCLDNSPYDLSPDDSEWEYIWEDGEIERDLSRFLGEGHDSTTENTLYITQL